MRTTLVIDDDVLAEAKLLAEREHRSVGAVISSLARQALFHSGCRVRTERNGIPLLPSEKGASPVTLELVNQLRDEQRLHPMCTQPPGR